MPAELETRPDFLRFLGLQASRLIFALSAALLSIVGFVVLTVQKLASPLSNWGDPAAETLEVLGRAQRSFMAIAGRDLKTDTGHATLLYGRQARGTAAHRDKRNVACGDRTPLCSPDAVFSGHCSAISVPDFLSFLQVHEKTGILRIVSKDEVFTLEIDRGTLIHATSDNPPPHLLLGEILVARGHTDREVIARYLARMPDGLRLGEALEIAGEVHREQLLDALQYQAQELFNRLCPLIDARFSFVACGPPKPDGRLRLNITGLLMESARVRDESG
jgi:hypothetical protein